MDKDSPKDRNNAYFSVAVSLRTKTGKIIRRDSQIYGRMINFIKDNNWIEAKISCVYGWGDNKGIYQHKNRALEFIRACRQDYNEFKQEGVL